MAQWEYCEFSSGSNSIIYHTPDGVVWNHQFEEKPRDHKGKDWQGLQKARALAFLGLQGWEAYAVYEGQRFFKRPVVEPPG